MWAQLFLVMATNILDFLEAHVRLRGGHQRYCGDFEVGYLTNEVSFELQELEKYTASLLEAGKL